MRLAWLCLTLIACDAAPPGAPDPPAKPSSCGHVCTAQDDDCSTFSYEKLPPRCQEVCYFGGCCELVDGVWRTMFVDCARPVADAGVDS